MPMHGILHGRAVDVDMHFLHSYIGHVLSMVQATLADFADRARREGENKASAD